MTSQLVARFAALVGEENAVTDKALPEIWFAGRMVCLAGIPRTGRKGMM